MEGCGKWSSASYPTQRGYRSLNNLFVTVPSGHLLWGACLCRAFIVLSLIVAQVEPSFCPVFGKLGKADTVHITCEGVFGLKTGHCCIVVVYEDIIISQNP